ncbi:MAG: UDP-2,3-diacylglucosamine diphosphatase LpxI, partial [Alphaproteobacteria bacterium]
MDGSKPLAVLAGSGTLPKRVIEAAQAEGREVYLGRLEGDALPANAVAYKPTADLPCFSLTKLRDLIAFCDWLHRHDVAEACLVGGVRKPSVRELLQPRHIRLLWRAARGARGNKVRSRVATMNDSALLDLARGYFASRGVALVSPQDFLPELLTESGVLGRHSPSALEKADIEKGANVLQTIAALDLGQGVVVASGLVLGVETASGTDVLLAQVAALPDRSPNRSSDRSSGGVLIKGSRPNQDA